MIINKGNYIQLKRKELKMKQEELALKVGLSKEYISRIENNHQQPSFDILVKISQILKFTIEDFMKQTGYINNTSSPSEELNYHFSKNALITSRYIPIDQAKQIADEAAIKALDYHITGKAKIKESLPPGAIRMEISDVTMPLVKNIRAGELGTLVEIEDDPISVPGSWKGKGDFCVKVRGNSMREEGIHEGMICLVRKQPTIESGNIALVYKHNSGEEINGVLKKAKILSNGSLLLINGSGENFEIGEDFEIIGKIIAWYKIP